jgi:hypothetical protein
MALVAVVHAEEVKTFTVRFSRQDLRIEDRTLAGDRYQLLEMEGLDVHGTPGMPCLPTEVVNVYVPRGKVIKQIRVESTKTDAIPGEYVILPMQQEIPLSSDVMPEPVLPDPRVYSLAEPYPASPVAIGSTGSIGGRKVAGLVVSPVQFVPADRAVSFNSEITFSVELADAEREPEIPLETPSVRTLRNRVVGGLVENAGDVLLDFDSDSAPLDPSVATEYLIICIEAHMDEYQALADWKTRKGVPARMLNRDEVIASYPGRDDAERIRNCIKDYYLNQGLAWALVTCAAPKANIRGCYCSVGGTVDTAVPCDLYFADMDGDWNDDGDAYWGETGDDTDLYADVYATRMPTNKGEETATAVGKILTYEGCYSVPTDYQLEMLFMAEWLDGSTDAAITKNMIDNESVPGRYDPITKLYESSGNLNYTTAMNALNAGQSIVNHDGHGNNKVISIGPSSLRDTDMMALTNAPRYTVFYTPACHPANYEVVGGCLGRSFVEAPNGGGFFVGNSRYGWYWPGNPGYGTGDRYDREFFESMFVRDLDHLGVIHYDAKAQRAPYSGGNGADRWTQFCLNVLGDPELPVWKYEPAALAVSHPESIQTGNHLFGVTVSSGGSPLSDARVCLWMGDAIYEVDQTNGSGVAQFTISAMDSGEILVTATKNQYLPYKGSILVLDEASSGVAGDLPKNLMVRVSPNPAKGSAVIAYAIPAHLAVPGKPATVKIYDAAGRLVKDLTVRQAPAAGSSLVWDGSVSGGRQAPSGIYFLRLSCGERAAVTKFVLLR